MKPQLKLVAISHLLCALCLSGLAQGTLTPPGAPAPTMKSLDQIEARTPVDALHTPGDAISQFILSQPGAYYLTTNVLGVSSKYGIVIITNNVTLDLNGFSLLGTSSSFSGIFNSLNSSNLTVFNGGISGWGAGWHGIRVFGHNATLEHLNVSGNGFGIECGDGNVIRDCVINGNQRDGIDLTGSGCFVLNNTLAGNNTLNGPGNASISIIGNNNRIEGNHVVGSGSPGSGILIPTSPGPNTNNLLIRNSVIGAGTNYSIMAGNILGPLINNTVSGIITNSNPWANFSF